MSNIPRETPAFPLHPDLIIQPGSRHTGMTLRDYFAAMAMMGTVNHPDAPHFKAAAQQAYEMADAMLAERSKANA